MVFQKQLYLNFWHSGPLSFSWVSPNHCVMKILRCFTLSFSAEYLIHKYIFLSFSSQSCCSWKASIWLSSFLLKRQCSLSFQIITKEDIALFLFHCWRKSAFCSIFKNFSVCLSTLLPVFIHWFVVAINFIIWNLLAVSAENNGNSYVIIFWSKCSQYWVLSFFSNLGQDWPSKLYIVFSHFLSNFFFVCCGTINRKWQRCLTYVYPFAWRRLTSLRVIIC